MADHTEAQEATTDISVLREMVRLAENRRTEALEMIEKINKYNLAIIAFAGTFLSLLVTGDFAYLIIRLSGGCLIVSIVFALIAIRPQKVKGGALDIVDDIKMLKNNQFIRLDSYLLDIADLTNKSAASLHLVARSKKAMTISAALFLACSLFFTYTLYAYA